MARCSGVLCVSHNHKVLLTDANFESEKILNSQNVASKFRKSYIWRKKCRVHRMLDKGHATRKEKKIKFHHMNVFVLTASCICKLYEILSTSRLLAKIAYN